MARAGAAAGAAGAAVVRWWVTRACLACRMIQTVRWTTSVRTCTGGAGASGVTLGWSATAVIAPSATSVNAPAIVMAGVRRI